MNKEPIALYIFRFVLGLGLFAFMAMLYWSSVLLEQDFKFVQSDLLQIKNELLNLRGEINKLPTNAPFSPSNNPPSLMAPSSSFPNLLSPDPFYKTTLLTLLGANFKPHGIRREAAVGKPDHLHPFSNWSQVANWISLCTVSLTAQKVGIYETYTPDFAQTMELRTNAKGQPEYWLMLRQDLFWQPLDPSHFPANMTLAPQFLRKQQVTAHDVKFYFDAIMNPHVEEEQAVALRTYYNDVEEVRVVDDFTLVVRWKTRDTKDEKGQTISQMKYLAKSLTGSLRPLARFVYQYFVDGSKIVAEDSNVDTYRTNPIWAQNFSHHWAKNIIVSCGAWIFDGLTEREIRFRRNPDYYDPYAVLVEAYEVQFKDSPDAIWQDFKTGSLDLFTIPPHQLAELDRFLQSAPYQEQVAQGLAIKRLDYVDRSYSYVGWNEVKPYFTSAKVRQALTLAIDRARIIRQNLNGMGVQTTGTFFPFSPSYDTHLQPYPFNLDQARRLLEEEGWSDSDGDGIIDKLIDGKRIPFSFTLTYYVKNPTTKAISEYIATTLKELGIICNPNGVDIADLSAIFEEKNFDAVVLGWSLGSPPEDPKQLWDSSGAKEKGSSNAIGFANPEIDKIIASLEYEYDTQKRLDLYHRFDAIIYAQAPYTFLYTPKAALIYREYLQNVFIPAERQDLIPGANVGEPQPGLFWIRMPASLKDKPS